MNESAMKALARRLAEGTLKKMALREGHEYLEGDSPWLDFLAKIFEQLLPILIGCLGLKAGGEFRNPRLRTRARLRVAIRQELGDRESIAEFAGPIFDAMLHAAGTVSDAEVQAVLAA